MRPSSKPGDLEPLAARPALHLSVREGFAVNMLNPAIVSFYVAVVPSFVPDTRPPWWFALLASLQGSVPAWLAAWMPPDTSWSAIAGIAVVFATVEASAGLAMRHALPWFGFQIRPDSLTATTIKLLMALGLLALLVLLGSL